jgi:hypothetical protein
VTLSELSSVENDFASAVQMLLVKAHMDGRTSLPMADLKTMLNRMGYSASGQGDGIRNLIVGIKNKNPDLVADVNSNEVILTNIPNADADTSKKNAEKVSNVATSKAMKDLGL